MLINRITTKELLRVDGSIEKYLKDQPDWQPQINESFEQVKDKIRARNYDCRNLGIPIDLNRDPESTSQQNSLATVTRTTSINSRHVIGQDGFNRFVLNVSAITGESGYTIKLQGSNNLGVIPTTDSTTLTWADVVSILPTSAKEYSAVVTMEYKYYRVVCTVPVTTPSITYTASMVETYIDRWITWQAMWLIYTQISKDPNDIWNHKAENAMITFQTAFDSYKFSIDLNEDNLIESQNDIQGNTRTVSMTR
jgi:hypothetical protein